MPRHFQFSLFYSTINICMIIHLLLHMEDMILKTVDIVVPCYNEQEMLNMFYDETRKVTDNIDGYNFNFTDDEITTTPVYGC